MIFSGKNFLVVTLMISALAVSGCDILSPKPKKTEKPAAVKPVAAPAEAVKPAAQAVKAEEVLPPNVLAKVGNWSITMDEFNERLKGLKNVVKEFDASQPGAKEMVLDELIRQQLLVYEARQQKLDQTKDIQEATKDFENTLLVQEVASRLVKDVTVTEKEAKEYYDANPDQFVMPVSKQLREIVVPTEAEAKDILVQVLQNVDFAQIAKDRSKGKSAANGGDLGLVMQAPFAEMQKEIEALKKGEVSRVFSGPEGVYIVKVEDVRGGDKKAFDEIKTELVRWMTLQQQQRAVLQKIGEVAEKVKVQVNADLLK